MDSGKIMVNLDQLKGGTIYLKETKISTVSLHKPGENGRTYEQVEEKNKVNQVKSVKLDKGPPGLPFNTKVQIRFPVSKEGSGLMTVSNSLITRPTKGGNPRYPVSNSGNYQDENAKYDLYLYGTTASDNNFYLLLNHQDGPLVVCYSEEENAIFATEWGGTQDLKPGYNVFCREAWTNVVEGNQVYRIRLQPPPTLSDCQVPNSKIQTVTKYLASEANGSAFGLQQTASDLWKNAYSSSATFVHINIVDVLSDEADN